MASVEFDLFRIHVRRRPGQLFEGDQPSSEAVLRKFAIAPSSLQSRRDIVWHVGNIDRLDDDGSYLRIGRTSYRSAQKYEGGNFIEAIDEDAPSTHVLIDFKLGLVAIARQSKVANSTVKIAHKFVQLIESNDDFPVELDVEIDPVRDPREFLGILNNATSVKRFWFTVSRPNHFERNQIIRAAQKVLEEIEGEKATLELHGVDLEQAELVKLTNDLSQLGENVAATVQEEPDQASVRRYLGDNSLSTSVGSIETEANKRFALEQARSAYHKIGSQGKGEG